MSGWFTPQALVGALATLLFAVVAIRRPSRGVVAYAILGATPPLLQMGSFAGRTISQGLLLAEVLATVLVMVWLARREARASIEATPFNGPLLAFAAVTVVSLAAAQALPDPRAAHDVTFLVSVGQVLLVLWPIGVYFVTANAIDDSRAIGWIVRAVLGLSLVQFAIPFTPDEVRPALAWAWTFGLYAVPLAVAAAVFSTSPLRKLFYAAIAVVPFVRGVATGKVFLYTFVVTVVVAILWVRKPRFLVAIGATMAATTLLVASVGGERVITEPIAMLVEMEQSQASWGGETGRGELARVALSIWAEAPLVGVGPGNSYVYMLQRGSIGTPHNQYLNILVEFGIIGLAVWLWFLVCAWRTGLLVYRRTRDPCHQMFMLGWLGSFAGMVVGSLTGDFMVHSVRNGGLELFSGYYLQWVLLGAAVSVARLEGLTPLSLSMRVPSTRPPRDAPTAPVPLVPVPPIRATFQRRQPRSWR
jgi:O-antigen ligase